MNRSTITRERLEQLANFKGAPVTRQEEQELARMALVAMDSETIYQYRIRNGYNGQVTEWQTIRQDQVDFVIKAQPINAEFRIIAAQQPAPVVTHTLADAFIAAIEKEQDRLHGEDYLMDSKDCIDVIREEALRLSASLAVMLQGVK
ncbi:hypothetical protein ACX9EL_005137 [Klebsiella oxytoca]|uniref:hypothetical protein n=1 Tax=Klebsiella aerogenes TaxID=548 RepID=UPI003CFAE05D